MNTLFYSNIIVNASSELTPCIRIAPFVRLNELNVGVKIDVEQLQNLIHTKSKLYIVTRGRTAIYEALKQFDLKSDDIVTIFTVSNNFYISGCVTKEIEKFCHWSREITPKTKLLLVNHEFGYPYGDLKDLKKYGLPIIEDRAHSLLSESEDIGKVGDYVVYSLPKVFPLQLGGVLQTNVTPKYPIEQNEQVINYILTHLYLDKGNVELIKRKRLSNYSYLKDGLKVLGIEPFFRLKEGIVPGVFLFKWGKEIDYPQLKVFMQSNGVESSVFYGENAFFIPCHHNLTKEELDYMINLLSYYYQKLK